MGNIKAGKTQFEQRCAQCHYAANTLAVAAFVQPYSSVRVPLDVKKVVYREDTRLGETFDLATYIANFMPPANGYGRQIGGPATPCSDQCAQDVAAYIKAGLTIPTSGLSASATAPLRDGVESASFDAAKWSTNDTISSTEAQTYSDNPYITIVGAAGSTIVNELNIDLTDLTKLTPNQYGRVMMRVANANALKGEFSLIEPADLNDYTLLATASPMLGADVTDSAKIQGANDKFMPNSTTFPNADWTADCASRSQISAELPNDTWVCLEWHMDTTAHELTYWLNGQLLDVSAKNKVGTNCADHRQNNLGTGPARLDALYSGIDQYPATDKSRWLYIEDVVVDTQRVGCPTVH